MRKLLTTLCAALVLGLSTASVYAEMKGPSAIKVEQTLTVTDEKPTDELDCVYKVVAKKDSAPKFETDEVHIKGTGTAEFVLPEYTAPGDYEYVITNETIAKDNYTLQKHTYHLTVRVLYAPNSDTLERSFWVTKDNETEKSAEVKYGLTYTKKPAPKTTPGPSPTPTPNTPPSVFKNIKTGDFGNMAAKVGLVTAVCAALISVGILMKRSSDRDDEE